MKPLQVHLWREWREHRRSLYFLAASLTLVVLALSRQFSVNVVSDPAFLGWTSLLVLATVVVSIGSDLFASEKQRGTDAFLTRVPGGLAGAFAAKLLFFWLLTASAGAFGLALGGAAHLSRTGNLPDSVLDGVSPSMILLGAVALLWVFTISIWVKSGTLTVPATALFLSAVASPVVWILLIPGHVISSGTVSFFLELAACGALAGAWVSFVRGGRKNHTYRRATLQGLAVACLCLSPTWAWAGRRYIVMQVTEMKVSWIHLGEGQRYAFLTIAKAPIFGSRKTKRALQEPTAVLLDMESGEWSVKGEFGQSMWIDSYRPPNGDRTYSEDRGRPFIELSSLDSQASGDSRERVLYDGVTGQPLELDAETRFEQFAKGRPWPPIFDQGGEKGMTTHAGAGYRRNWWNPSRHMFWDPATDRSSDMSEARDQDLRPLNSRVLVGPGRWLAKPKAGHWMWFDPETNETEVADCLEQRDLLGPSFDDGSLFLVRAHTPYRLDTVSGELQQIAIHGTLHEGMVMQSFGGMNNAPLPSNGRSAMHCRTVPSGEPLRQYEGIAVLDALENTIHVLDLVGYGVRVQGDGFALVQEELSLHQGRVYFLENPGRLLRLDMETLETRVVFDLDDMDLLEAE